MFQEYMEFKLHTSMHFKQFALSKLYIRILFMIFFLFGSHLRCHVESKLSFKLCSHVHTYIKLIPATCYMLKNTLYDIKTFILVHCVMFSLRKLDLRDTNGGHL